MIAAYFVRKRRIAAKIDLVREEELAAESGFEMMQDRGVRVI